MHKIITTDITDPFLNLAIENDLLLKTQKGQRQLFLYQNSPCVVIGRFQNPWIECNIAKMVKQGVPLLRRQSGGGTVYHDEGNLNFSFIADRSLHSQSFNHELVVQALKQMGVIAYATARGDIRLSDGTERKISGSAFKQKKDQAFHHGTMLITSDLDKLNSYITSNKQNMESKSIASVRSQVANISESHCSVTKEKFIQSLQETFINEHQDVQKLFISKEDSLSQDILEYAQWLKSYQWKIMETPKFKRTLAIDEKIEIEIEVKKTKIQKISLIAQGVHPLVIDELEKKLQGSFLELSSLQKNLAEGLLDQEFSLRVIEALKADFCLNEVKRL